MTAPYTPRCPECFHSWPRHRAIDAMRVTLPDAKPRERIRLQCQEPGCPCYGQQLPAPPDTAAGRLMRSKVRRKA